MLHICQGYLEQAAALAEQAARVGVQRNHAFSLAWARSFQARSMVVQGHYAEAEDLMTQAMALCDRHGLEARKAHCLLWRGIARLALGNTRGGLPEIRQAIALWISVGGGGTVAIVAVQAAESAIRAGLYADGDEFLRIGEQVVRDTEARLMAAEALRLRGKILVADGRRREAEAKLREALALAQQQGARLFALRAATDLAKLLIESGNDGEADAMLRPIYGSFTEGFDAPDLKRAAAVLATLASTY
jgi:ATP/maltotriose-dependent transcriptional regulator MalT